MARILIVDDEDAIRAFVAKVMEMDGHEIMQAENGQLACDMFSDEKIDLVITDLVMPEKNGIQMMLELKKSHPDLKVVAMSGGSGFSGSIDLLSVAKLIGAEHILKKPFTLEEIRDAVNSMLDTAN